MNATLDRLEDAVVRQRRFIADASHELRSPIAVLRTQLEVALAHPDPALWPDLVSDALEDTVRLQDLASDLLLLARLDAAEPVEPHPLDMAELCRTTVAARHGDRLPIDTEAATRPHRGGQPRLAGQAPHQPPRQRPTACPIAASNWCCTPTRTPAWPYWR